MQRIEAQRDRAASALPAVESRACASRLSLGMLVGSLHESEAGLAIDTAIPDRLLPIRVGERSEVLRRRPDVVAAERRLAAATADIGVATAELFPKLTLSASAGFRSLGLSRIVDTDSQRGAIGPLISWHVFDGGRVHAEIAAAESRLQFAALGYEKTVVSALTDAERALSAYDHSLRTVQAQRLASASVRKTLVVASQRFELGDNALVDVLDAEREWSDQEVLVVQAATAAAVDQVALFKALGVDGVHYQRTTTASHPPIGDRGAIAPRGGKTKGSINPTRLAVSVRAARRWRDTDRTHPDQRSRQRGQQGHARITDQREGKAWSYRITKPENPN